MSKYSSASAMDLGRGRLYAGDGCPESVAIGDVKGDDFPDLVMASGCSDELSVLVHK